MLILPAKLDEMGTLDPGDVVADEVILPIPGACACLLRVHVIGRKGLFAAGCLAKRLHVSAQRGELCRIPKRPPLPVVPQVAIAEVIRKLGVDGRGHPKHQVPGYLRTIGKRCGFAQGVAGEKTSNVHLVIGGVL